MPPEDLKRAIMVPEEEVTVYEAKKEDGIIGMMDCGGSNLVKINEQIQDSVRLLVTSRIDHKECSVREKQKLFNVPLVDEDFEKYEAEQGGGCQTSPSPAHSLHAGIAACSYCLE